MMDNKGTEVYGEPRKVKGSWEGQTIEYQRLESFLKNRYPYVTWRYKLIGSGLVSAFMVGSILLVIDPTPAYSMGTAILGPSTMITIIFSGFFYSRIKEQRKRRNVVRDAISRSVRIQRKKGKVALSKVIKKGTFLSEGKLHELLIDLSDKEIIGELEIV